MNDKYDDINNEEYIKESLAKAIQPLIEQRKAIEESIKPLLENQEKLRVIMQPILEQQLALREQLKPFIEQRDVLQESLRPIIEYHEAMKATIKPISDVLMEFGSRIRVDSSAIEGMHRLVSEFAGRLEGLGIRTKEAVIALLSHGWYIDEHLTPRQMDELAQECEANIEIVEEFLCSHYESQLNRIEEKVVLEYPHRANIIKSALDAHRNGAYELSIPILMIQVDGICKEKSGGYFFMRPRGIKKPETSVYVDDIVDEISVESIRYALLIPLMSLSPLHKNTSEREADFDHLNRHLIIHGDSFDYNTRVNSYKTISVLNYIMQVFDKE